MKISEILELVRAGYTKAEIDAMNETPEKQTEVKEEDKQEEKQEEQQEEQESVPEVKQESETEKLVKALGLKFDTLISTMQQSNVNSLEMDGTTQLTAEDVIAGMIDPQLIKGGK